MKVIDLNSDNSTHESQFSVNDIHDPQFYVVGRLKA